MLSQTQIGKAFEFALLKCAEELFIIKNLKIEVMEDSSYMVARDSFSLLSANIQTSYLKAAHTAIEHIALLEPRLENLNSGSELILQIIPDSLGIKGDVRDVLFIRSAENWEIGVSAKHNHKAVKHSRLSNTIDFGLSWLNINNTEKYFADIKPVFDELKQLKSQNELWRNLNNKMDRFYLPVLNAFKEELLLLDRLNSKIVPAQLLKYLIGNKDFYKVIKNKSGVEVFGFNIHGTLNRPSKNKHPDFKVPVLKMPTRIIELDYKPDSKDTLILVCDGGWQISFRIHNASSKVEPSLKFDINLIGQPQNLYTHHLK